MSRYIFSTGRDRRSSKKAQLNASIFSALGTSRRRSRGIVEVGYAVRCLARGTLRSDIENFGESRMHGRDLHFSPEWAPAARAVRDRQVRWRDDRPAFRDPAGGMCA